MIASGGGPARVPRIDRGYFGLAAGAVAAEAAAGEEHPLAGAPVAAARRQDQEALIRSLDEELPAQPRTRAEQALLERQPMTAERGYELLKHLVVFAYFTSEPVAKGLINAPIIPGRYDGCISV